MSASSETHVRLHSGFTMIELLVAIIVFSLGLLGLAALMTVTLKTNHAAYLRSQALFLAQSLTERMRSNPIGVWNGNYNFTANNPVNLTDQACDATTACSPAQVAAHDLFAWNTQLVDFLPAPPASPTASPATVVCTASDAALAMTAALLVQKPPYDGVCTVTINWSEKPLNPAQISSVNATVLQTFALAFQP